MTQTCIFETEWGYCGFAVRDNLLIRNVLPVSGRAEVRQRLLRGFCETETLSERAGAKLKRAISLYFQGFYVDFSLFELDLTSKSSFSRDVLVACRNIPFGKTVSYSKLAEMSGHPGCGRAVGNVMANNDLPLIIPCHRVIKADGKLGGFLKNQDGAANLKAKLLDHEQKMRALNGKNGVLSSGKEKDLPEQHDYTANPNHENRS